MGKYRVIFLVFIYISSIMFFLFSFNVFGQETTMPLTIEPVYPESQNPQTKGYFDLNVNPEDELTLSIELTNHTDKEKIVSIEPANAFTSHTGGMLYQKESESEDVKLLDDAIRLADSIQVEESVTISPNSTVKVPIQFTVPKSDGQTILGGLLISSKGETIEEQQEVEEGTANFTINTETVFAMAIQLNLPNSIDSNFQFGEAGFYGDLGQVYIQMINDAQKIQENVVGTYTIQNENGEELYNGDFGPFKMSPKSAIRYPIEWGAGTLEDGTYSLYVEVAGDLNVNAVKEFKINNEDIAEFVEKSNANVTVAKEETGIPSWIWIVGIILFGLLMFVLGRRKVT